jgi:hypothetical protein
MKYRASKLVVQTNTTTTTKEKKEKPLKISDIVNSVFVQYFSCKKPLLRIQMGHGVWKTVKNSLDGLCVYCGCLVHIEDRKMTSYGISCLRHALPCYPLAHPIWKLDKSVSSHVNPPLPILRRIIERKRTTNDSNYMLFYYKYYIEQQKPVIRRLLRNINIQDVVLNEDTNCFKCHMNSTSMKALRFVSFISDDFAIMKLPLCKNHFNNCKRLYEHGSIPFHQELLQSLNNTSTRKKNFLNSIMMI